MHVCRVDGEENASYTEAHDHSVYPNAHRFARGWRAQNFPSCEHDALAEFLHFRCGKVRHARFARFFFRFKTCNNCLEI